MPIILLPLTDTPYFDVSCTETFGSLFTSFWQDIQEQQQVSWKAHLHSSKVQWVKFMQYINYRPLINRKSATTNWRAQHSDPQAQTASHNSQLIQVASHRKSHLVSSKWAGANQRASKVQAVGRDLSNIRHCICSNPLKWYFDENSQISWKRPKSCDSVV